MSKITPEERAAMELRVAVLVARMDKLDHLHIYTNVPESATLNEDREALDKQLDDEV